MLNYLNARHRFPFPFRVIIEDGRKVDLCKDDKIYYLIL